MLHVANYDRWRATLDGGDELPIATVPALGVEYPMLTEVPVRDRELEFRYVYRAADWAGLLLTLAALPIFAAVTQLGRRRGLGDRLAQASSHHWRALGGGALGGGALAGVLLLLGLVAAKAQSRERLLPPQSIFHRLEASGSMMLGDQPCSSSAPLLHVRPASRASRRGRGSLGPAPVHDGARRGRPARARPDRARPVPRWSLRPARRGHGQHPRQRRRRGARHHRRAPRVLRQQDIQFDSRERRHQQASVEVVLTGTARTCFDLQTVD